MKKYLAIVGMLLAFPATASAIWGEQHCYLRSYYGSSHCYSVAIYAPSYPTTTITSKIKTEKLKSLAGGQQAAFTRPFITNETWVVWKTGDWFEAGQIGFRASAKAFYPFYAYSVGGQFHFGLIAEEEPAYVGKVGTYTLSSNTGEWCASWYVPAPLTQPPRHERLAGCVAGLPSYPNLVETGLEMFSESPPEAKGYSEISGLTIGVARQVNTIGGCGTRLSSLKELFQGGTFCGFTTWVNEEKAAPFEAVSIPASFE